jgi:hypothetical protein
MRRVVWGLLFSGFGCSAGTDGGDLAVTLVPKSPVDAKPIRASVVATSLDGTIGVGTVRFSATPGEASPEQVELDAFGSASTNIICDPSVNPECRTLKVAARWTRRSGVLVVGEVRGVAPLPSGTSGGSGGSMIPSRLCWRVTQTGNGVVRGNLQLDTTTSPWRGTMTWDIYQPGTVTATYGGSQLQFRITYRDGIIGNYAGPVEPNWDISGTAMGTDGNSATYVGLSVTCA